MVGVQVTQARVNEVLGGVATRLHDLFNEIATLKEWNDITTQEVIESLGFTPDDAYLVKLIIDELAQLRTIYAGAANLANAKDFREQARKARGLGL
jgi:hypothetical protein